LDGDGVGDEGFGFFENDSFAVKFDFAVAFANAVRDAGKFGGDVGEGAAAVEGWVFFVGADFDVEVAVEFAAFDINGEADETIDFTQEEFVASGLGVDFELLGGFGLVFGDKRGGVEGLGGEVEGALGCGFSVGGEDEAFVFV
jgi:hypothetical protein